MQHAQAKSAATRADAPAGHSPAHGCAVNHPAFRAHLGLDLAIVILPPPHDPAVLTPLADALSQLR
jgi:hypothetical protein